MRAPGPLGTVRMWDGLRAVRAQDPFRAMRAQRPLRSVWDQDAFRAMRAWDPLRVKGFGILSDLRGAKVSSEL